MYMGRKAMPVANKHLSQVEWRQRQEAHKERMRTIKPGIDTKGPKEFPHLYRNGKKEQLLEDRYAQIEHENRILLNKMSDIMTRRAAFLPGEGAGAPPPAWAFSHSLNRDSRRKELRRITDENMRILRRIQSVAPRLDHRKWEEDRMKQERLLINITEYHKMSIGSPTMPSEAYLAAEAAATARRSVSPPRRMAPLHSPGGRLYPQQSLSEQQSSSLGSPHYVSAMVSTLDSGAVGGSSGYVPGGPGASASSLPAMDASGSGSISGGIQTAGSLSPSGSQHAGAPAAPGPANAWNRANLGSAGSYGSLLGSTYGGGGSVTGPAFDSGSVVSYASFGSQMPRPDLSQPYQPPAAGGVVPPKPSYVPAGGAPAPGYDFSRLLSGPGAADASSAFLAGTGKFGIGTGQFSGAGGAGGAPRGASAGGPGAEAGAAGRAAMLAGLGGSTATLLGSTSVGSMSMGGSLPSTAGTVGTEGLGATGTTLLAGVGTGSGRQTPSGLPGSRGVLGGVGSNIVGSGAGSRAPSGGYLRSASVGSVQSITTPTNAAAPVFPPVQPSAPQ